MSDHAVAMTCILLCVSFPFLRELSFPAHFIIVQQTPCSDRFAYREATF
jgi:hypothetical protein